MAPTIAPVTTTDRPPSATTAVVIGGGIVGLTAALTLAERGIPVTVIEKGRLGGEQSSRNLGWVRKMGRSAHDLPLAMAADRLWNDMSARVGAEVGYRRAGILYLARKQKEMDRHLQWLTTVAPPEIGARWLSPTELDNVVPGGRGQWIGGLFTASDGRAEPTLAVSAIAKAAQRKGAVLVENCAVRALAFAGGRVSGVYTEHGEVRCDQVILAGGMWSRRFLINHNLSLLTLPVVASVLRTAPMEGPTDIAVGGPDFSFRRHHQGGYVITQRGAFAAPLTLDSVRIGHRYLKMLREEWHSIRPKLGADLLADIRTPRHWSPDEQTPFETVRVIDPPVNTGLNAEALRNLSKAWPQFAQARIEQAWAGMIDVTPDGLPVIGRVAGAPGLTVATGFSGHGFGTSPAAGQLAADLATNETPLIDPEPYRLERQMSA